MLSFSGYSLYSSPAFAFRQIPLFDLFDSVVSRGGFAHVTMERIWHHVAFSLNLFPFASHCSAVLFELKKQYEIYLLEYELHLFRRGLPVSLPRADGTTVKHGFLSIIIVKQLGIADAGFKGTSFSLRREIL